MAVLFDPPIVEVTPLDQLRQWIEEVEDVLRRHGDDEFVRDRAEKLLREARAAYAERTARGEDAA